MYYTVGYLLAEDPKASSQGVSHAGAGPLSLLVSLFFTMREAHDRMDMTNKAFARTIMLPTLGGKTTACDRSSERAAALYRAGEEAARACFRTWDFAQDKAL